MLALHLHRLALAALLLVPPLAAPVSVGPISLEKLVARSDAIVIGRVERVITLHRDLERIAGEASLDGPRQKEVPIAVVTVIEMLKGPPQMKTVHYLAGKAGTCDITSAAVGESVLLFLDRAKWMSSKGERFERELREVVGDAPTFDVMHAGRGRMPIRGSTYVSAWSEVEMPPSLLKKLEPQPEHAFINTFLLGDLRAEILAAISRGSPILHAEQQGGSKEARWRLDVWSDGRARLRAGGYEHFKVDPERLAELWRIFDTEHFTQLPTQVGAVGTRGEWRTLELETAAGRHKVRWSPDAPGFEPAGGQAAALGSVLRLWIHVRGLVNDPEVLDTREQDRALLDRLR